MAAQYQVSDALKERHPYNVSAGFREQAIQDKAKLFDGFGDPSFKYNIESLMNEEISVGEKAKMLKHLLGHLTNADTKVRAVKHGLVQSLKWLADHNLGSLVDELVCMTFRAVAVIPAGVFSVHRNQALPCIITVLSGRLDQAADQAMLRAREAACDAICQLTIGWHAKWLLLGEDVPQGMVQLTMEPSGTPEIGEVECKEERQLNGRRAMEALTHLITHYNAGHGVVSVRLMRSALEALANLSADPQGLDMCLICGVLREVDELLRNYANSPSQWIGSRAGDAAALVEMVNVAVTVVWNVCMDPIGKRQEEALTSLPFSLGKLLLPILQHPLKYIRLKAAISGALSAIFIYEDAKNTAVMPLLDGTEEAAALAAIEGEYCDIAALLFQLLREGNEMVSSARSGVVRLAEAHEKEEMARHNAEAVVKNTVQSIRLLSEVPSVRGRVAELIAGNREICLQVFKGTLIEQQMTAACGVKA